LLDFSLAISTGMPYGRPSCSSSTFPGAGTFPSCLPGQGGTGHAPGGRGEEEERRTDSPWDRAKDISSTQKLLYSTLVWPSACYTHCHSPFYPTHLPSTLPLRRDCNSSSFWFCFLSCGVFVFLPHLLSGIHVPGIFNVPWQSFTWEEKEGRREEKAGENTSSLSSLSHLLFLRQGSILESFRHWITGRTNAPPHHTETCFWLRFRRACPPAFHAWFSSQRTWQAFLFLKEANQPLSDRAFAHRNIKKHALPRRTLSCGTTPPLHTTQPLVCAHTHRESIHLARLSRRTQQRAGGGKPPPHACACYAPLSAWDSWQKRTLAGSSVPVYWDMDLSGCLSFIRRASA